MVSGIRFVDGSVIVGPRVRPFPHRDDSVAGLLRQMDRCGIDAAYVSHASCLEYDPQEGNARLMQEIGRETRLRPVWVLVPASSGEMAPPRETLPALRDGDIRLVRFFPGRHNFPFTEWNLGDWFDLLAERRVPVMLDLGDVGSMDPVYRLAEPRPHLPVILSKISYRPDRGLFRLMERLPNLHIETSTYKPHLGIERMVTRFGEGRLVFGSSMTEFSPGPALAAVMRADIPLPAKRAIAGANLERLTGAVQW